MQIFTPNRHIGEEALGLYALNDLPESNQTRVAEHLSCCGKCRREFRDVQEFVVVLRLAAKAQFSAAAH